ncbi:DUF4333 domain-containing protein [Nodosilinea sp. P-1105]|uniref:DUF4333 domain-containing protein n=1 Tax=Nodosilinea sp. P-1105 TaxID=2546229 RepID=UPI00146B0B1F|nr:DUF4333 domain-containing protein [Nodosilinea sp. P-1105]NMF85061.1 DUF4333 domain-containing protein [Nodosilinea sp. P-1105]
MVLRRRLTTAIVGLAALAVGACGDRLNTADIEATLKADIERQGRRLVLQQVHCPRDVTPQAGAAFQCVGELASGDRFTIHVTQPAPQGTLTWEVPNSKVMLNLSRVEETIQQRLFQTFGQSVLVDCGTAKYRPNQPGDQFQCEIVGGLTTEGATFETVLVTVGADGNLTWHERRANWATAPDSEAPSPEMERPEPPGRQDDG